jgi:hypothetical protein
MDFPTRDSYRHVVERIARKSNLSESEVARMAIRLAGKGSVRNGDYERAAHVGFYLIDKGLSELEHLTKVRLSPFEFLTQFCRRIPLQLYIGSIILLTAIFTGILLARAHTGGLNGWPWAVAGLISILCTSHLAVALVN